MRNAVDLDPGDRLQEIPMLPIACKPLLLFMAHSKQGAKLSPTAASSQHSPEKHVVWLKAALGARNVPKAQK